MKKRLSILLLTLIMVLTLAPSVFARSFELDNTNVIVPSRFNEVQASKDAVIALNSAKKSLEILIYLPIKYQMTGKDMKRLAQVALKETMDTKNSEIPIKLKTVMSNGRKVYYFGASGSDDGVYSYAIIALVPNNGHCMMASDVIVSNKEAGAFPFSKKDAKKLADRVAVG